MHVDVNRRSDFWSNDMNGIMKKEGAGIVVKHEPSSVSLNACGADLNSGSVP